MLLSVISHITFYQPAYTVISSLSVGWWIVMGNLFYLHEYSDGSADMSHSCGFVKVEHETGWMMSSRVSLEFSIRGMYSVGECRCSICALVPDGDYMSGIKMDDIAVNNGFGRAKCEFIDTNMGGSGFDWNEAVAVAVVTDAGELAAVASWDDTDTAYPYDMIRFGAKKNTVPQKEHAKQEAVEEHTEAGEKEIAAEEGSKPEFLQIEEIETKPENGDIIIPEEEKADEMPLTRMQVFSRMQEDCDYVDAFDDDTYYDCIEITPDKLRTLLQYECTGAKTSDGIDVEQNSFLMHGFYTFRHILAGRVQSDENAMLIGVPGVYSNKERFIAGMFGFNNFRRSHRSDCRNPYFGYWYREI